MGDDQMIHRILFSIPQHYESKFPFVNNVTQIENVK
jgi:hypothetical protein